LLGDNSADDPRAGDAAAAAFDGLVTVLTPPAFTTNTPCTYT
jgi:hypothetical protein